MSNDKNTTRREMKQIKFYLPEEVSLKLKETLKSEGKSMQEVIEGFVEKYLLEKSYNRRRTIEDVEKILAETDCVLDKPVLEYSTVDLDKIFLALQKYKVYGDVQLLELISEGLVRKK